MRIDSLVLASVLIGLGIQDASMAQPERHQPVVVAELPGALQTAAFFRRIERTASQPTVQRLPALSALTLENRLPLVPSRLQLAQPTIAVAEGLVAPLFVIGLDDSSLRWFQASSDELRLRGARGLVVAAPDLDGWERFRDVARSLAIPVQLIEENVVIEGYGLRTYPALIVGSSLESTASRP